MDITNILLVIALISNAAWIGEVVTLNFIIIPNLNKMEDNDKASFIAKYFPQFFRMATVLALITVISGFGSWLTGGIYSSNSSDSIWNNLPPLLSVALVLVLILTTFHLVVESRLRPMAKSLAHNPDLNKIRFMSKFLNIVPRLGFLVIVSAYAMVLTSLMSH